MQPSSGNVHTPLFTPPGKPMRRAWLVGTLTLFTTIALWAPQLDGKQHPALAFDDDAYYYFQIARNLAAGHGFTFDGIHTTNGFQPLWLFLLVPVFWISDTFIGGDLSPLLIVAIAPAFLVTASALMILKILETRVGPAPAWLAALLVAGQPQASYVLAGGMESALLLAVLVGLWRRWLKSDVTDSRDWLVLGVWSAAAFLTRLEAIVTLPVLLILGGRRLWTRPRALTALVGPPLAAMALYFTWNRLAFGLWLPVSAMVKAVWAKELEAGLTLSHRLLERLDVPWALHVLLRPLYRRFLTDPVVDEWLLITNLTVLGLAALFAWRQRHAVVAAVRTAGIALAIWVSLLMLTADKLLSIWLPHWYRVPVILITSLAAAALLRGRDRLAQAAIALVLLGVCLRVTMMGFHLSHPPPCSADARMSVASWLNQNTTESDRIGSWNAGLLGYFSHRHVIALDGLVGDKNLYQQLVLDRRLVDYLGEQGVNWVADYTRDTGITLSRFQASLFSPGALLNLNSRFQSVARFPGPSPSANCPAPGLAVWQRTAGP